MRASWFLLALLVVGGSAGGACLCDRQPTPSPAATRASRAYVEPPKVERAAEAPRAATASSCAGACTVALTAKCDAIDDACDGDRDHFVMIKGFVLGCGAASQAACFKFSGGGYNCVQRCTGRDPGANHIYGGGRFDTVDPPPPEPGTSSPAPAE